MAIVLLSACTLSNSVNDSNSYAIRSSSGEELGVMQVGAESISIRDKEGQLTGVAKRADKRKYYDASNVMVYAVKLDDDGFKLRNGNEQLIWKVKLYPDKIKIANNEEMIRAYEIKLKEDGKLKLEQDEREIKSIRLSAETEWNEVEDRYSVQGFGNSLAPGILLINDLKDREKFIIMAELLKRNR